MLKQILLEPIIPVVEVNVAKHAMHLADAVLKGGINILEVVLRTEEAVKGIEEIRKHFPEMLVGAGTVLSHEQADRVINAGAQFGVAPGLNTTIVDRFHRVGLPFVPGVITPTEVEAALQQNCSFLKFFPAEAAGGTTFLKALTGPYAGSGIQFCATGGITLENMNTYLSLPIVNAIGGSWLATREQIETKQWQQISNQVEVAVNKQKRIGENALR